LLGTAAGAALANLIWPSAPGDGTEGTSQTQVEIVPGIPGQPGKVTGVQYLATCHFRVDTKRISTGVITEGIPSVFQRIGTGPVSGPIQTNTGGYTSSFWGLYFLFNGKGSTPVSGASGLVTHDVKILSVTFQRTDGTSLAEDIAQGTNPGVPDLPPTQITQNITNGGVTINIGGNGSPPPLPTNKTPTAPPPSSPPQQANPTPTGTAGTDNKPPTPSPSPNPQPAPPLTTRPSAPNTTSGNPTNNAPTTGPRPSPGANNQGGGSPGSRPSGGGGGSTITDPAQIAALIAGVSPGVAAAIGLINNAAKPKTPTPTGNPIGLPDNNSPTTGPNTRPPGQGDPTITPGQTQPITNERGEVIGSKTEIRDENGNTTYIITQTTNNTTINNVTNQIDQSNAQNNAAIQDLINQITNPSSTPTNTTTVTEKTFFEKVTETQTATEAIKQDTVESLAILGTLATATFVASQTATITAAIQNQPSPCSYPSYHPQNQAERAAISGKVDGVNTVLGTVTNVQIAEAKTGITSIIDKIGSPIANTGATLFEGINKIQEWGTKFSQSLRLDRVYNALAVMLQIHNAAILSRNLGESLGFLIDASLQALRLKDENDEEFNLTQVIGTSIENFIKSIVGNDIYEGASRQWKLISAIYSAAINIYEMSLSAFGGLAEGISVIGEYQGKIGNALKRSGGVMQNAYDWMEENFKVKMTRAGYLGRVADQLQEAEDVVSNVTELPESINEVYETWDSAADEIKNARQAAEALRLIKVEKETENKADSVSPNIADNDAFKPPI
jgi:hypothetical protein